MLQAVPGLVPLGPIASGHYRDTFTRHRVVTDPLPGAHPRRGQWRFAERRVSMSLLGDLSHHLRG